MSSPTAPAGAERAGGRGTRAVRRAFPSQRRRLRRRPEHRHRRSGRSRGFEAGRQRRAPRRSSRCGRQAVSPLHGPRGRYISIPGHGRVPRSFLTVVRYPAVGSGFPRRRLRRQTGCGRVSADCVCARVRGRAVDVRSADADVGARWVHRRGAGVSAHQRSRSGWPERVGSGQPAHRHELCDHPHAGRQREDARKSLRANRPA